MHQKGVKRMHEEVWNPWHGCKKYSEGCQNCYVYRRDGRIGLDASEIKKNKTFDLPIRKNKNGEYKIPSGSLLYCCMTSDFFLEEADPWRMDIWDMIRLRKDLHFMIITKRIARFETCIPTDWKNGWDHVSICCTIENQKQCDIRMPYFLKAPIKHKYIVCEPLLEKIQLAPYLNATILRVIAGGESGPTARICHYEWILDLREQCLQANVSFSFKQTGALFLKDGKTYRIPRKDQHSQAKKAAINTEKSE